MRRARQVQLGRQDHREVAENLELLVHPAKRGLREKWVVPAGRVRTVQRDYRDLLALRAPKECLVRPG